MVSKRSLRWKEGDDADELAAAQAIQSCPLCGRPLTPGDSIDEHHLTPRSQGGREKHLVHKVCHKKIHQTLKPRELARQFNTWDALKTHPEIHKFIEWVQKRPSEFIG